MEFKDEYVADMTRYSGPLREGAKEADKFKNKNDEAALAARRMGLAAKEAAEKAARAQKDAADAAEKLARGELSVADEAKAAARAENELERASIKAAEAQRAAGRAADKAADNFRQMARAAALAAAAERLAWLKASGSVKEHNSLIRKLEGQFGDLSKEGSGAFKAIESTGTTAFEAIGSSGPVAITAIAVGLSVLPFAATVAAGGVALAFGGALSAIAIKSQLANKDVQAAFAGTSKYVSGGLKNISTPFHATLLSIAADGRTAFDNLKGSLAGAFAVMAPAITRFGSQFTASLTGLNPAITSIGRAFSVVLASLGSSMPTIMRNLGASIKSITDAAAANPQALTSLVVDISQMAQAAGTAIATMIRYKDVIGGTLGVIEGRAGALPQIWKGIKGTSEAFVTFGGNAAVAGSHLSALDKDMQTLASTTADATAKANALTDAFARLLNPAEAVFADTAKLKDSIGEMSKALDKSHGSLNDNTTASRAAKQAFTGLIDGAKTLASDMLNSGKNIGQVRAALQPTIAQMYAFAGSNQKARALVDAFVHSLDGMPANKKVALTLDAQNFFSALHNAQGLKIDPKAGLLKGNNSDYLNKWLKANGLRIDSKTGLLKGNNSDYYNKWLKANGLHIDPKTGVIKGNTSAFWSAVHSIPSVVGNRQINVRYVPVNSANQPGTTRHADGGIDRYANGGVRRDLDPMIVDRPTVLFGETETGGEAYIPLGASKRARSTDLLEQVADMFGLAVVKPLADGMIEKYAKGKVKPPTKAQKAAAHRVTLARARPEYLAAMAAQHALESMRASIYGGFFRGGASTIGSAHGSVVQHVTTVNVNVAGSIRSDQDIAKIVQRALITNRMPVSLPTGR